MEAFLEQPKFPVKTGSGTEPLRHAVGEDKDSGVGSVTSLFLPFPYSLPFPVSGGNNTGLLPSCVHIEESSFRQKSEKVAKLEVLQEGNGIHNVIAYWIYMFTQGFGLLLCK